MISPLAHVDPSAKLGRDVKIHAFAYIDANVEIGDGCEIMPYASVMNGTRMGKNNKVYQGAIIGADPQDFRWKGDETYCFIGENNVIREHTIINRGISPEGGTRIGNDVFIMADSHIGHDSVVEGKTVIGNGVNIAGNAVIGECSILSSAVIVHEGCKVGSWVLIKGGCRIGAHVPPYTIMAHNPTAYFGVNAWVMRKKGFTEAQIDDAAKSYRHIYQSGTSVSNALRRIQNDIEDETIRETITKFVRDANLKLVAVNINLED